MTDKEQMRLWILQWEISKKHKEIMALKQNKQEMDENITKEEILELYRTSNITEQDLFVQCQKLIFNSNIDTTEEELYWHFYYITERKSKADLLKELINSLRLCYAFIAIYQEKENYELCQLLLDCIEIYKVDYVYSLVSFFEFTDDDQLKLDYIDCYYKELLLD